MNLNNRSRCTVAAIVRCNLLSQNVRKFISLSSNNYLRIFDGDKIQPQVQFEQKYNFSLSHHSILYTNQRTSSTALNEMKKEIEEQFAPEIRRCLATGRLIVYEGQLKRQIAMVKVMSLTSSAMGLALQPALYSKMSQSSLIACIVAGGAVGLITFISPLLLHLLCKRYVTTIYYLEKEDKYVAASYNLFGMVRELEFKTPEDVEHPEIPGPLTTIYVKKENRKIPLFIAPTNYSHPFHYKRIMGWDQPVNLRLNTNVDDSASTTEKK